MSHKINDKFINNIKNVVNNAASKLFKVKYIGDVYVFENEIDDFLLDEYSSNYDASAYIMLCEDYEDIVSIRGIREKCASKDADITSDNDLLPGDIVIRLYRVESIEVAMNCILHELIHYLCAYRGYEYSDESSDFRNLCKQYGVLDNYSNREFINGHWHTEVNEDKMWEYYKALI